MSDRFGRLEGARSALAFKAPVRAATTANVTLSGYQTIDGVVFAASDDNLMLRLLVKDQNDITRNGLYEVQSGDWTRCKDFDGNTDFAKGTLIYVTDGGTNGGQIFRVTSDVESVGEDNITFSSLTSVVSNEGYQRTSIFEFIPPEYHADIVDGTSVVDVSEYILDAIAEIDKGILFFPAGKYIIGTEIYCSKGILFEGSGNAHQHDVGSEDYGTLFSWTGTAGGTMVRFEPVNGASAQRISGGGFVGIGLDGESLAGQGLVVRSVNDACFDFYGTGFVKASKTITAATNANPCVITSAAHGLASNDVVLIKSVGGMTELNGNRYVVTSVTANTFALQGINSTAYGVYTSGGTAEINGYVCYVGVTLGTLGEAKDTQYNRFRISGKQLGASSGPVLLCDGDSINLGGNCSRNHFEEVLAIHQFDDGVVIGCSDDNVFTKLFTFDFTGGLDGVKLLGASSLSNVCGQNYFVYAGCAGPSGGRFVAKGTATYPVAPAACKIEFWDFGNASGLPVIEAGATVTYYVADGSNTTPCVWNMGQSILAQKIRLYQSGNDVYGIGMASGAMRLFAATGGKLSLGIVSNADGTTYTETGYADATGITATNATGLGILDSNSTHRLALKTTSNLTVDRDLTLVPGDAARTVTISGDATINQDTSTTGSPTFAAVTLGNTGLHVLDTNASHYLTFVPGTNLTANHTLTFTTGDADRTVTLSGNPTLSDWFDQSVKAAATPTFGGLAFPTGAVQTYNATDTLTHAAGFLTANFTQRATNFMLGSAAAGSMCQQINIRISAVNFNSANTDNAITITLPTGFTRYRMNSLIISGASASLTTATFGLFTAAAAGGTAIVASGTAITVNTASESTNNNSQLANGANAGTMSFTETTLYFRVQTAQGSAATASVTLFIQPLS